ncbi:hypothetical protein [Psychroflexus sp. MES1-P1E]|uniref:hypothetical protein n=1 Tax=Psychroflexus sp. MES1-P1E TaxID=2058320 RepID=UPI0011AE9FF1|nr:hypothetical protein [Psychroflexus sp. MES1-P1E]
MKIGFLRKYSLLFFVLILIFSVLFYFLLMGAAGHGFYMNSTDTFALIIALCGIFILPNYRNGLIKNKQTKNSILILSMIIAIGTIILGITVLKSSIDFNYGDDVSGIVIGLFYAVPLIFIIINGIILNEIVIRLLENTSYTKLNL